MEQGRVTFFTFLRPCSTAPASCSDSSDKSFAARENYIHTLTHSHIYIKIESLLKSESMISVIIYAGIRYLYNDWLAEKCKPPFYTNAIPTQPIIAPEEHKTNAMKHIYLKYLPNLA